MAETVRNMQAMWETWVSFLGREDSLEKGMATHSSIPARRIPWTEDPGRLYSPWGHKELDTTEQPTLADFTQATFRYAAIPGWNRMAE